MSFSVVHNRESIALKIPPGTYPVGRQSFCGSAIAVSFATGLMQSSMVVGVGPEERYGNTYRETGRLRR